jgi:hypothetical protein
MQFFRGNYTAAELRSAIVKGGTVFSCPGKVINRNNMPE